MMKYTRGIKREKPKTWIASCSIGNWQLAKCRLCFRLCFHLCWETSFKWQFANQKLDPNDKVQQMRCNAMPACSAQLSLGSFLDKCFGFTTSRSQRWLTGSRLRPFCRVFCFSEPTLAQDRRLTMLFVDKCSIVVSQWSAAVQLEECRGDEVCWQPWETASNCPAFSISYPTTSWENLLLFHLPTLSLYRKRSPHPVGCLTNHLSAPSMKVAHLGTKMQ